MSFFRTKGTIAIAVLIFLEIQLFLTSSAYAKSVYIVYGNSHGSGSFTPSTGFSTVSHGTTRGGGILLDYSVISRLDMEFGFLYIDRGFGTVIEGQPQTETTFTTLQLPILLNFWPLPFFHFGLGVYYARGLGTVRTYPIEDTSSLVTEPFGQSIRLTDYGLTFAAGFRGKIFRNVELLLRGQHIRSALNSSTVVDTNLQLSDYQIFLGLKILGK